MCSRYFFSVFQDIRVRNALSTYPGAHIPYPREVMSAAYGYMSIASQPSNENVFQDGTYEQFTTKVAANHRGWRDSKYIIDSHNFDAKNISNFGGGHDLPEAEAVYNRSIVISMNIVRDSLVPKTFCMILYFFCAVIKEGPRG